MSEESKERSEASCLYNILSLLIPSNRNPSVFVRQVPNQKTAFLSVPSERHSHNYIVLAHEIVERVDQRGLFFYESSFPFFTLKMHM